LFYITIPLFIIIFVDHRELDLPCFVYHTIPGIILKMARLTKDASLQGQKSGAEFVIKAPSKILIIPAEELVQVIAQVCYFSSLCNYFGNCGSYLLMLNIYSFMSFY
jgi:hypothetical protein